MKPKTDRLPGRLTLILTLILIISGSFGIGGVYGANPEYPQPRGYVNDFENIISPADEKIIEQAAKALEEVGNIELAVAVIASPGDDSLEGYSIGLAEFWGIGSKETDEGLLFLLAIESREVRIEVGYGLEGDLPDGLTGSILDRYVIPLFKKGDFSSGMREGSLALAATLAEKRDFDLENVPVESYSAAGEEESADNPLAGLIFAIFIITFVLGGRRRLLPFLLLGHMAGRSSRGGGFGTNTRGGGFGSSGSSGFGGFGGGSFGGGGASRSF